MRLLGFVDKAALEHPLTLVNNTVKSERNVFEFQ